MFVHQNLSLVQFGVEGTIAIHTTTSGLDTERTITWVISRWNRVNRRGEPAVIHRGAPVKRVI